MDRCGQYLGVAADAAKRRFGVRATVAIEESTSVFPERHRWVARVRVRNDVVFSRSAPLPEAAARLLADALVAMAERDVTAGRALLDRAAVAGIG